MGLLDLASGGLGLFTYFVWRVDLVCGLVLSTSVVVYARNLRLIHKIHLKYYPVPVLPLPLKQMTMAWSPGW